ncbi:hypothetical protein B0H65DRAFT_539997 [Neurospora tetraspora]|uniref:Uncharacterized protein n=1 Tax=Neurospora tetraspora TaxID=94610 RepID=A0AAE0JBR5_9PEZI|nr:hypothetical protein B0H65DRAFT_539997 [Neurospora tetraspora]
MFSKAFFSFFALAGTLLLNATAAAPFSDGRNGTKLAAAGQIWLTPHDQYSSSVGVLGCKVDINHMAYWPEAIGCDDICVEVTAFDRTVTLLRVDNSVGAHDISFNNWNYLETGYPATVKNQIKPSEGFTASYKTVDPNNSTSINYISNCVLNAPNSWIAKNFELWNIYDSQCNLGYNEICETPDFKNGFNQAKCTHTLGSQNPLAGQDVWNIRYPSGDFVEVKGPGQA